MAPLLLRTVDTYWTGPRTPLVSGEPDKDPGLLRAFLAVAREGYFGHAAAELKSPSLQSTGRCVQMEGLLGVELLVRGPRGTELTNSGELVVPEAERVPTHNRHIVHAVRFAGRRTPVS